MDDYYDLGTYARPLASPSAACREWARRGLLWTYGFHHEEAIACYDRALEEDPACAFAHWGRAYAMGPNYNFSWALMDEKGRAKTLAKCHAAAAEAQAVRHSATPAEATLIDALSLRYPQAHVPDDIDAMSAWNTAFADRMAEIHRAHTADLDIRAIYAEALLNITPWQMWDLTTGKAAAGARTEEAQSVLEEAFATQEAAWQHPGL
ncbi:MAG: hypothetical protein AAF646_12505, partial [Pseudomonadota bacterium]